MRRFGLVLALLAVLGTGRSLAQDPFLCLPPGGGPLIDHGSGTRDSLLTYGDGHYENAMTWQYGGVQLPYYGAFAECFSGDWLLDAVVLDLTQLGGQEDQVLDAYVWNDGGGIPGGILAMEVGIAPGPVAYWPNLSRHYAFLHAPYPVHGPWWVGYWPNWPGEVAGWYVGCDHDSPLQGCVMTNIAPGIELPTGWHSVDVVWGGLHSAIGVSALVQEQPTSAQSDTWGSMKALFR
jgi:hypothetical protein